MRWKYTGSIGAAPCPRGGQLLLLLRLLRGERCAVLRARLALLPPQRAPHVRHEALGQPHRQRRHFLQGMHSLVRSRLLRTPGDAKFH